MSSSRRLKITFGSFFLCFVFSVCCASADNSPLFGFSDSEAPWHIEADVIQSLGRNEYSALGGVVVTRGEKQIRADAIHFDGNRRNIVATGNVVMTAGPDISTSDRLEMNLEDETGIIYKGELLLERDHFHLAGDRIEKIGPESYRADRIRVTTCDPADPDWQITGRDLSLTIEGYGSMRHAALWVKNLPVLYTPYLFFPVKIKRQTGFLVPELNYSERKWEEYVQPFYWAINDSSDMTLYTHHMGRRGLKLGAEYRRVFSEQSRMIVMADGFSDLKTNTDPDDDYGYDSDSWLRPNSDRYWLRVKQDQALPGGVAARLDIDFVSDQDYLLEFRDGYMGFDQTDRFFTRFFGRDLDDYNEATRTNSLNLNKRWARYNLNTALIWEDNVINRRWQETDMTAQRLPVVNFNAARQAIAGLPLYYNLQSEYTNCFREEGTRGHRTDVYPRLYLPFYWRNFVSVEPSVGVRETAWWIDDYDPSDPLTDRTLTRTVYDMQLDLSSELYRIFSLSEETGAGIKHAVLPRVNYEYVLPPPREEGGFPVFDDDLDSIEPMNLVTYSIVNNFTLRRAIQKTDDTADRPDYRYREFCRFKLEQSYDIQEAREEDPYDWKNRTDRQPFSPILAELYLWPIDNLKVDADASWDIYRHGWAAYNLEASVFDNRGDRLSAAYRYEQDRLESVSAAVSLALSSSLTLYTEHERNLHDHIDIETRVGCLYTAGCWSLDVNYTDGADDRRYAFMINLFGLGEAGTGVAGEKLESPGAER